MPMILTLRKNCIQCPPCTSLPCHHLYCGLCISSYITSNEARLWPCWVNCYLRGMSQRTGSVCPSKWAGKYGRTQIRIGGVGSADCLRDVTSPKRNHSAPAGLSAIFGPGPWYWLKGRYCLNTTVAAKKMLLVEFTFTYVSANRNS